MSESSKDVKKTVAENKKLVVPYPGADEKYIGSKDWRLYDRDKYFDPDWSPDKE